MIAIVPLVATFGCGGHSIRFKRQNERVEFDFLEPRQCSASLGKGEREPECKEELPQGSFPLEDGRVEVRYLGAGGVYIGWGDKAILFAPFFSNPPGPCTFFGDVHWDRKAIQCGLAAVPMETVGAIIAGHSHYDHFGDLPVVAGAASAARRNAASTATSDAPKNVARNAALLVNCSGRNALEPYGDLMGRVRVVEALEGCFTQLRDKNDNLLRFRVRPIVSRHAPHLTELVQLWKGTTKPMSKPWESNQRWSDLKAGWTYNFIVDLTDGTSADSPVRFRLFFQDSASLAPAGLPPAPASGDPPYDLAILGMASSQFVEPYPEDLLRRIKPRHVVAIHYENFTKPWSPRRKFAPLLTRRVAERFLLRVEDALGHNHTVGKPPGRPTCGPSADRWTMPLPGERLVFHTISCKAANGSRCSGDGWPPSAPACDANTYANSGAKAMKAECAVQGGE